MECLKYSKDFFLWKNLRAKSAFETIFLVIIVDVGNSKPR